MQTDPGPFSGAPDGALVEAQNVVYDRPGLIEPRGGWKLRADTVMKTAARTIVYGLETSEDERILVGTDFAGAWSVSNGALITSGPTSFAQGKTRFARAKGRTLLTSENGVCEMPLPGTGAIAYRAGLPQPSQWWGYLQAGGSGWLANNTSVAYRFTIFRTLSDGTTMESAPTPPLVFRNTTGAGSFITFISPPGLAYTPWTVGGFDVIKTGDMLRVYRAPRLLSATGVPSDEMRLRASLPITVSLGVATVQQYEDSLGDNQWNGPELYTNTRREGIGQARARPHYARDMALYQGRMMYAGLTTPQRVAVTCKSIGESSDPQQTIVTKTITVTTTIGTTALTAISAADVKYIAAGQWITINYGAGGQPGLADARFSVDTQIVSVNVGAGSAVISKNALASGAISVTVWDWVGVEDSANPGVVYRQWAQEPGNTMILDDLWLQAPSTAGTRMGGYATLEYSFNNAHVAKRIEDIVLHATGSDEVGGLPEYRNVLMVFERASASSATFRVLSTKPNAFDQVVGPVTGITSKASGGHARLGVSVLDIPDAVPEGNYLDIGDESQPIYRIAVAKSSLLIFKGDGIFQLFGDDPSNYRVQLLDATITPPAFDKAADWITQRGEVVYMMSQRGPVRVTEAGADPIGGPIWETIRENFGPGFFILNSLAQSMTSGSSPATPYVLWTFQTPSAVPQLPDATRIYVYNVETNAWTTWTSRRATTALWSAPDGQRGAQGYMTAQYFDNRVTLGTPVAISSLAVSGDTVPNDSPDILSVTPNGPNRYTIVIAAGSEWTPTVGDVMICNAYSLFTVVESVASATTFDVIAPDVPGTGSATYEEGYPIRVVLTMRTLGTVDADKRYIGASFAFALRALLLRLYGHFQSAYAPGGAQDTETPLILPGWTDVTERSIASTLQFAPEVVTCSIPQDVVMDWGLRVGFTMQQARAWFSLGAVTMEAESGTNAGRAAR